MNNDKDIVRQRRFLHEAIARVPTLDDEMPDSAFLVGWVLVAEFADPDGGRWFCGRCGTDGGETDVLEWTAKGYLTHALDEGLFNAREADDEDEDEGSS